MQERALGCGFSGHSRKTRLYAVVQRLRPGSESSRPEFKGRWPSDGWARRLAGLRHSLRGHGTAETRLCFLTSLYVSAIVCRLYQCCLGLQQQARRLHLLIIQFFLDIMNVCVCARARAAFRLHSDPSDGKSGPTPMQQACPSQQDWDPSCWNTQVKAAAAAVAPLPFLLTEYNVGCCLGYPQHDTSVRETGADVQTKRNTHQLI